MNTDSNIIYADHDYGNDDGNNESLISGSSAIAGLNGHQIWETESSAVDNTTGISGGLAEAENIYDIVALDGASAYNYWWIHATGSGGLLQSNWQQTPVFWATANFSKFIRPGWVEVGESGADGGLLISAFKNPTTGNFATVLINPGSSAVTETIDFNGAYSPLVTPWVTSATQNLAQQQSIPATGNGGSYTYTVPADSVVTLAGTATATPVTASTTPVGLLAAPASTSTVALSWTNNLGSSATGYTVERSTNGTTWTTLTSSLSSSTYTYTDTGLTANTQYYYQVVANNNSTVDSNVAAVMTLPPPTSLTASYSASTQDVTLNWTGNGSSATDYAIDVSTNGGSTWTTETASLGSGTTSYTDTSAPDLATLEYRVRAIYGANSSAPTNVATVTTTVLRAPSGLTAALSGTSIALKWTDNTTTDATVQIERSTNGTTWTIIGSVAHGTQAYTDSTVSEGGTYYYQIYNDMSGTLSAVDTVGPITVPPSAPTHAEVEFSSLPTLMALVVWDNNSAADTAYEVDRSSNGGTSWTTLTNTLPANSTSYTDTTVASGQAYEYRVEALIGSVPSASLTTLSETASALPSPYAHGDIGDPSTLGLAGSASYNSSTATYTLNGSGADIWNTSDGFQFAYTTMTGNGQIGACVTSVSDTNAWAKAGLMFRNDDAPDAAFADVVATPGSGVSFQWRTTDGGNPGYAQVTGVTAPVWLRLTRSGNQFSGYYSSNDVTWTQIGGSTTIAMGTTAYVGMVTCSHDSTQVATATFTNVALTGTVAKPPTVATAAAASPSPVTGTTSNLSVLGSDGLGAADLMYTWAATTLPSGAAAPTFSSNGATATDDTTATFSQAGTYGFTVTIVDLAGLWTTSTVNVTVNRTATSLGVSPGGTTIPAAGQVRFTATVDDQFGAAMTSAGSATWSVPGNVGTIDSFGLYSAPTTGGTATVHATQGSLSGSATVTVTSTGIFATDADIGSPSPAGSSSYNAGSDTYTVAGGGADIQNTSDQFNFLYKPVNGNATLIARVTSEQDTNTWAKAGVMFRNSAAAGDMEASLVVSYSSGVSFQWRSSSGGSTGYTVTGGVSAPAWIELVRNGNTFTAYYATTTAEPTSSQWIQEGSAETIAMGTDTIGGLAVTSHDNGVLNAATFTGVQITGATTATDAPVMTAAATASPNIVTGTTTSLSAAAIDDSGLSGEGGLKYTWSTTGTPPGSVKFSANGTHAAQSTVATFGAAGTYNLEVTIVNPAQGQSVTSSVNVIVNQTLTSIRVAGQPPVATAYDQFNNSLVNQPAFNAGTDTITGPLTLSSNVTVFPATGSPLTIAGQITGAGALTIDDPGTVVLSGANGYTGGTIVSDGTLVLTNSSALGRLEPDGWRGCGLALRFALGGDCLRERGGPQCGGGECG